MPSKNEIKDILNNEFLPIEIFLNYCIVKFDDIKINEGNNFDE